MKYNINTTIDNYENKLNCFLLTFVISILFFFILKTSIICECSFFKNARYKLHPLPTNPVCYAFKHTSFSSIQNFCDEFNYTNNVIMIKNNLMIGNPQLYNYNDYFFLKNSSSLKHPHLFYCNDCINNMLTNHNLKGYYISSQFTSYFNNSRPMNFISNFNLININKKQLISSHVNFLDGSIINPLFFDKNQYVDNNYKNLINDFFKKLKKN